MRFILKSAFWLGLVVFLLPGSGSGEEGPSAEISWFTALIGAEQALQDVTGFCDRAPAACEAGSEIAAFAGERIGDGIVLAYRLIDGRTGEAPPPATDPILTGAVGAAEAGPIASDAAEQAASGSPVPPAAIAGAPLHGAEMAAAPAADPIRAPIPTPAPRA